MKYGLKRREIYALKRMADDLHEDDRSYRRASNYDFFLYLLLVFLVAFSVRTFVAEPILVEGDSMLPTLHDGERVIVVRSAYYVREPQRGDIIVCYYPGYTVSCVKRVIGLPGEYVLIDNGKVYVNGNPVDESMYWDGDIRAGMVGHVVQQGTVFVMGDNRNESLDSRSPDVGDIPYNKIVGKVISVAWPIKNWRNIETVTYPPLTWNQGNPDAIYISGWELYEEQQQQMSSPTPELGGVPGAMPEE